ncbi:MAG: NAD(P)H-dependent oxidoreductase [Candidatus Omnitrophota bacterium]
MFLVYDALKKRASENLYIRVAVIGAGAMARPLVLQMAHSVPGMRVCAVANRTLDRAKLAFAEAGFPSPKTVSSVGALEDCIRKGVPAVTENPLLVCQAEGIDAVIEVTGTLEFAAHAVMEAIRFKKHVILMNAELDGTLGAILKVHADRAGVVLTNVDGDQPGVIMNLYRDVQSMGLRPVMCGNIKGLQDRYRNPTTQEGFARKWKQGVYLVSSFADGTKISFEQAVVANATGMRVFQRGMLGPVVPAGTPLQEAIQQYPLDKFLERPGIVDYVVGAEPLAGVFVLATIDHPVHRHYLALYKVGDGPLYCFYVPYHLCHFLAPFSIARAVIYHDATIAPHGAPTVEVVATAKKDLKKGEVVDPIGGYMTYGQCENADAVRRERLLPMGLGEGCRLLRDVPRDQVLTCEDVAFPAGRLCDMLRAEQETHFGGKDRRREGSSEPIQKAAEVCVEGAS